MKDMRSILFGALLGSLGMVGCGGDDGPTNTNMDGGTADGGGTDSGMRRDATVAPTYEFAVDKTAQASGAAFIAARATAGTESLAAQCECFFFNAGFASAEECVTANTPEANTFSDNCNSTAYEAAPASVKAFLSCTTNLSSQLDDCLDSLGCGEENVECFGAEEEAPATAFDAAYDSCVEGVMQADYDVYSGALTTCLIGTGTDTCGTGTASSALGAAVFSGTTQGAGDHRIATMTACGVEYPFNAAPDKTFTWTAPSAGTFKFDTAGVTFDSVLYALSSCAEEATFLGCNDDGGEEVGPSELTLSLTAGQTIYLVVDGYAASNGDFGDFEINITQLGGGTSDAGVDAEVGTDGGAADAGVDATVTEADAAADAT